MNETIKKMKKTTNKTEVDGDKFTVDIKELRTELNKIRDKYFTPVPVEGGIRYVPIKNKSTKSDINENSGQDHPFFE